MSGAQPTYAPTSNLLKDFTFNKQAQNGGPVGEVDSSKANNNGQLHSKLEIDPFALTSWAPFHPTKTELESVGRHRVPNFGPNPTSPVFSQSFNTSTRVPQMYTAFAGGSARQDPVYAERPVSGSMHVGNSFHQGATEPNRHPRPEDIKEIQNLNTRLSQAYSQIESLKRELENERRINQELRSRPQLISNVGPSAPGVSTSAMTMTQTSIRNPFGGVAFTNPPPPTSELQPSGTVIYGQTSGANASGYSNIQPSIPATVSLTRPASVGVLPRHPTTSLVSSASNGQYLLPSYSKPQEQVTTSVAHSALKPGLSPIPQQSTSYLQIGSHPQQTLNPTSSVLPAASQHVQDNTTGTQSHYVSNGPRETHREDTLLESHNQVDILRIQAKLKEANNRIRYLAEENDRLVARLLKLKAAEAERVKILDEQTSIKESFLKHQNDFKERESQLEAEILHMRQEFGLQQQYTSDLLESLQQVKRQLDQERSKHELSTFHPNDSERVTKEPEAATQVPQTEAPPKKKKVKSKEPQVLVDPSQHLVSEPAALEAPITTDPQELGEPKPKKKKKTVDPNAPTDTTDQEKPKKPKKKAAANPA